MKAFLELPICKERHLKLPTTELQGSLIVNIWKFQSISFACQGNWDQVEFSYEKNEYDFNTAIEDLVNFIKKNS
tara:strand:- start:8369 stop:8590 length:222 start_codon:yes stop_codon:yes gene_type:complete